MPASSAPSYEDVRSPSKNRSACGCELDRERCAARSSPSRDAPMSASMQPARFAQRPGRWRRSRARLRSRTGARPSRRARSDVRVHHRNRDRLERGEEAGFAVVGDHDRRGLVGAVDRDLLADIVGVRAVQSGRAHEDHRLGREVDVLLVLGDVARDRLVAELRQLDPDLFGRDAVDAVADDRPRAAGQRVTLRGERDRRAPLEHLAHRRGQLAQRGEDLLAGGRLGFGVRPGTDLRGADASSAAIANASRNPAAICA